MLLLDDLLKITQIGFYFVAAIVGTLTYIKAKNGLLNTVNTEYHKHVLNRLAEISSELASEYDFESPKHWSKESPLEEVLTRMHEDWLPRKHEIIANRTPLGGIPVSKSEMHFLRQAQVLRSDPFIPPILREKFVDYYNGRAYAMHYAFCTEIEKYQHQLANGELWETLDENYKLLHNRVMGRLRERGGDVPQVEQKVHELRDAIQMYFRQFDTVRRKAT